MPNVSNTRTYASVVSSPPVLPNTLPAQPMPAFNQYQQAPNQQHSGLFTLLADMDEYFNGGIAGLMNAADAYMEHYSKLTTTQEKRIMLLIFIQQNIK